MTGGGIQFRCRRIVFAAAFLVVCSVGTGAGGGEAPSTQPDAALLAQGRFLFQRNCVVCHGTYGDGRGEMSRELKPRPRNFTAGIFKYRSTPSGTLPTDADLLHTIRDGVGGTAMPTFAALSDREIQSVIAHLKTLSRRWRDPKNYSAPLTIPTAPDWLGREAPRKAAVERGRSLFQSLCAACHGVEADGKGPAAAGLEDWTGEPTAPPDLRTAPLRSGSRPEDLYRLVVTGLDGTPMPSFLESTTEEQRWELIAFILDLRRPE